MRVCHDFDDPEGFCFEFDEPKACNTNIDSGNRPLTILRGRFPRAKSQPSMPMIFSNGEPIAGAFDTTHVLVLPSMQDNVDYIAARNFEGQEVSDHVTTAMLLMPIERIKQLCVERSISFNGLSSLQMITKLREFHGINRNFSSSA